MFLHPWSQHSYRPQLLRYHLASARCSNESFLTPNCLSLSRHVIMWQQHIRLLPSLFIIGVSSHTPSMPADVQLQHTFSHLHPIPATLATLRRDSLYKTTILPTIFRNSITTRRCNVPSYFITSAHITLMSLTTQNSGVVSLISLCQANSCNQHVKYFQARRFAVTSSAALPFLPGLTPSLASFLTVRGRTSD